MSNRVEPEIPSITLDQDLVKSSKSTPSPNAPKKSSPNPTTAKPSKALTAFVVIAYIGLAGASGFFYQEYQKQQQVIAQAEQRIAQLEDQLSATGEEMGESTIALRTKLQAMTEKTDKLWDEMDKLWASAWRRNQQEIKDLRANNSKQGNTVAGLQKSLTTVTANIKDVNDKQTAVEFNIDALTEQLNAANNLKTDLEQVNNTIAALEQKFLGRSSQQRDVATSVNEINMQVTLLIERIEKLEAKANSLAASTPPTASPVN